MPLSNRERGWMSVKIALVWAVLSLAWGCIDHREPHPAGPSDHKLLGPSKFHEECRMLRPGQSLAYSFTASGSLEFNIHYHDAEEVIFPVSEKAVTLLRGRFDPQKTREYCMMWTNPGPGAVELVYDFEVTGNSGPAGDP